MRRSEDLLHRMRNERLRVINEISHKILQLRLAGGVGYRHGGSLFLLISCYYVGHARPFQPDIRHGIRVAEVKSFRAFGVNDPEIDHESRVWTVNSRSTANNTSSGQTVRAQYARSATGWPH